MWAYKISTGQLLNPEGKVIVTGWSGWGDCKNNPEKVSVKGKGPIPPGVYDIGESYKHPILGRVVMNLEPHSDNEMYGRSLFRIHGAANDDPNTVVNETEMSSHGCIIMPRQTRVQIAFSNDRLLEVIR